MDAEAARVAVAPWLLGDIRIREAIAEVAEWADHDTFGNPGRVVREVVRARGLATEERADLLAAYLEAGFTELPRDGLVEDDQARLRLSRLDPRDPFLWERDVEVGVGGRTLSGVQQAILEKKAAALRAEVASDATKEKRRAEAARMLEELEAGLLPSVSAELTERRFHPDPHLAPGAVLGTVVPLRHMSRLVYTVVPRDPADRDEEDGEPMLLTILGVDERQAAFQFSGGLHGQRTVIDLDGGLAHHAWFMNRQNETGEDTAPWVSRRILRELREAGESEMIVRWERDPDPNSVRRTGEGELPLVVDGVERRVPALFAETDRDDRLAILVDPESPLVLRLEESGAELLRTIDAVTV